MVVILIVCAAGIVTGYKTARRAPVELFWVKVLVGSACGILIGISHCSEALSFATCVLYSFALILGTVYGREDSR